MDKKCAFCALNRLIRGYFGFGGFFFHQLFVLVIDGGLEDGAATAGRNCCRLGKWLKSAY
jgi:hypothetical protein